MGQGKRLEPGRAGGLAFLAEGTACAKARWGDHAWGIGATAKQPE